MDTEPDIDVTTIKSQVNLPIYSADTSSIINVYRVDRGKTVLEYLSNTGRLRITPGVFHEIEVGGDEVFDWVNTKQNLIVQELTSRGAQYTDHLVTKYADSFVDSDNPGLHYCGLIKKETASDADPEVIALAYENNYVVLADETSGIKGACKLESIPCINTTKLIDEEYPRADKQLTWSEPLKLDTMG